MAYGQFIGYEPHPAIPGAYNFQTANGQALTFGGPEAETLKSRLDAYGAAHTVAGPGGGDTEPAAMAPAAPPTPQPRVPAPMQPVMVNGINTGYVQDQTGRLYEQQAGTAGISQEQLQKRAGQGVATPNSESETVRGAKPINEEYLAERDKLNQAEHAGMEQEASADAQAYQAGQQAQHQNLALQTGMMDAQQQQVQAIQQQVAQAQATRDQALAEYSSSKVDPSRIFSGGVGVLKSIGAALAAGAGAWGATIGHTRNFAQEIIDSAVNRDIAAQEAEIRIKKDTADNALSDLMRRGMSLDQAKNTLMTIQNQWMQRNMADAATKSGDERIAGQWQQQVAERDKQNLDYEQAYRDKAAGEATKTVASKVMYPQAGSAGGLVPVAAPKALGIAGTTANTEGTIAGTAKTTGEAVAAERKAKAATAPKPNIEANSDLQGLTALDALKAKDPGGHIFVEGGTFASKETEDYMAHAKTAATQIAQRLSGGRRPNPVLYQQILEGLTNHRESERKAFQKAIGEQLELKRKTDVSSGAQAPAPAADAADDAAEEASNP